MNTSTAYRNVVKLVRFRKNIAKQMCLLIDDIQFLARKERIQEEFFPHVQCPTEGYKQIVLTSRSSRERNSESGAAVGVPL